MRAASVAQLQFTPTPYDNLSEPDLDIENPVRYSLLILRKFLLKVKSLND